MSSPATALANPYLDAKGVITYRVLPEGDGFRIEVVLPSRGVPSRDRVAVIRWLQDYGSEVRAARPNWTASFRTTEEGYSLAVGPALGLKNVPSQLEGVGEAWQETLKHGSR